VPRGTRPRTKGKGRREDEEIDLSTIDVRKVRNRYIRDINRD
jgi:hypothetical protein